MRLVELDTLESSILVYKVLRVCDFGKASYFELANHVVDSETSLFNFRWQLCRVLLFRHLRQDGRLWHKFVQRDSGWGQRLLLL